MPALPPLSSVSPAIDNLSRHNQPSLSLLSSLSRLYRPSPPPLSSANPAIIDNTPAIIDNTPAIIGRLSRHYRPSLSLSEISAIPHISSRHYRPSHLLEEAVDLTGQAAVGVGRQTQVLVAEEVVPQHGRVRQRLEDGGHEAGVAQVDHAAKTCRGEGGGGSDTRRRRGSDKKPTDRGRGESTAGGGGGGGETEREQINKLFPEPDDWKNGEAIGNYVLFVTSIIGKMVTARNCSTHKGHNTMKYTI